MAPHRCSIVLALAGACAWARTAGAGLAPCAKLPLAPAQLAPVCLAMQADRTRLLEVLPRLSRSWAGSISAAVLTHLPLLQEQRAFSREGLAAAGACGAHRVGVTLVEGARFIQPPKLRFPANLLRNVALRGCADEYVLSLDADHEVFPPLSAALLSRTASRLLGGEGGAKLAVVVPPFSVRADLVLSWQKTALREAPYANKRELRGLYRRKIAIAFNSNFHWKGAHATNYSKWLDLNSSEPYRVRYESGYEPYLLMRTDAARAVPYDPLFVGYGFNRCLNVEELHAAGFEFTVSPELYTVHTHVHHQANREHESAMDNARALADGLRPGSAPAARDASSSRSGPAGGLRPGPAPPARNASSPRRRLADGLRAGSAFAARNATLSSSGPADGLRAGYAPAARDASRLLSGPANLRFSSAPATRKAGSPRASEQCRFSKMAFTRSLVGGACVGHFFARLERQYGYRPVSGAGGWTAERYGRQHPADRSWAHALWTALCASTYRPAHRALLTARTLPSALGTAPAPFPATCVGSARRAARAFPSLHAPLLHAPSVLQRAAVHGRMRHAPGARAAGGAQHGAAAERGGRVGARAAPNLAPPPRERRRWE